MLESNHTTTHTHTHSNMIKKSHYEDKYVIYLHKGVQMYINYIELHLIDFFTPSRFDFKIFPRFCFLRSDFRCRCPRMSSVRLMLKVSLSLLAYSPSSSTIPLFGACKCFLLYSRYLGSWYLFLTNSSGKLRLASVFKIETTRSEKVD